MDNQSSLINELLQPGGQTPQVARSSALVAPAVPEEPESTAPQSPSSSARRLATVSAPTQAAGTPGPAGTPVSESSRRAGLRTVADGHQELPSPPPTSERVAAPSLSQFGAAPDSAAAITGPETDSSAAPPALFDEIAAALASTQLPRPEVPPCKPYLILRRELHQRRLHPQRPTTRVVLLTQALGQPASEPERIEPPAGEALPLASGEEQELRAQLDRYGSLQSINDITLNIAPFTHRKLDETQTDQQPPLQDKPGNAAALVLRQAGTVHYVSGPPRYPVSYRGLLSLANFCHRPLYFQEINLERYGTHHGIWQPALSAAHFFAVIPQLPYRMAIERPNVCYHYYHPYLAGRPAPWERELPPLRANAALWEAGVILGLVFLIP
ncbi:MAG: hypothetical protein J5I93_14550 [Pirellulaceae bacterium]|nr:hypothetical protein [Pirellulaceae bacterium]